MPLVPLALPARAAAPPRIASQGPVPALPRVGAEGGPGAGPLPGRRAACRAAISAVSSSQAAMRARSCRCRASSSLRSSLRGSSSACDSSRSGAGQSSTPSPARTVRRGCSAASISARLAVGTARPPRTRCASSRRTGSSSWMLSARLAGLARAGDRAPGAGLGLGRVRSACLLLPARPDPHGWQEAVATAAGALQAGGLVAVPTDTVYGVACLAQDSGAVRSIYSLKGRNGRKPLAICLGDVDRLYRYCQVNVPDELLRDLLPGPVTLVLKRSEELNKDLNPFTSLVGVRIPNHPFLRDLARACAGPLALTSANFSSQDSTLTVTEFQDLWPHLSLIIDGGPTGDVQSPESRLGSTVVDLSVSGKFTIIRPGCALASTVGILRQKYGLTPTSL
ncbi:threonylcarbamoyl-AMP synthase [Apus apus]|uniref:threonylcarbamoyl-AMP synthase n=1 Tax=Apus apus TaxID=8895 RepID=UPI0021F902DE|nr:threonylcarbamoyl-AMP synthase [Apus apus]